jgi:phosphate transport system substrate-binding protein
MRAIWAAYTERPLEDFRITHHQTHNAYMNLINRRTDLILVTYPSNDELRLAAARNVQLEIVPIVPEAFVFIVHADNPVESLTLEQILDIYTGAVTNWNQVGGLDQPIDAYQRPPNSGSQSGMLNLVMGGTSIMNPPTSLVMEGMGGLIDVVADYRNGPGAIGYSYYYFVTDMYRRQNIKLLAVDGVRPTPETIADRAYPLATAYYAVIRADTPADHPVRELIAFMLSPEGQAIADAAGYVPHALTRGPTLHPPRPFIPATPLIETDTYTVFDIDLNLKVRAFQVEWGSGDFPYSITLSGMYDQAVQQQINAMLREWEQKSQDSYYHDSRQFAGLLILSHTHGGNVILDLNTGDLLTIFDLFESEESIWEAIRGAAYAQASQQWGADIEARANELMRRIISLDDIGYNLYHNGILITVPVGEGFETWWLPLPSVRGYDGLRKFDNPGIAPVRETPFVFTHVLPIAGNTMIEAPAHTPYIYAWEQFRGHSDAMRAFEEAFAAEERNRNTTLQATPQDTGLYYYSRTILWPHLERWDEPPVWRLVRVQEQSIRVEVPREAWDTVWKARIECWLRNRPWSADSSDVIRLSDYGRRQGWEGIGAVQETYTVHHVDPVTGKRYDTIYDFFMPGYDPKPAIMDELRLEIIRNNIPLSEIEAIYGQLMVSGFWFGEHHNGFSFTFNWERDWEDRWNRYSYWPISFTVHSDRFDMTQFAVERWSRDRLTP